MLIETNLLLREIIPVSQESSFNTIQKSIDLFDKTLLLLRKDLFASATSLSVSVAKEQWGVHYPINDNVIKLDLDQLQEHIKQQWQDIRYLRSIARDYNINHSIWLEDYPTDISLWRIFNNKEAMPNTGLSFPTYKSPSKSQQKFIAFFICSILFFLISSFKEAMFTTKDSFGIGKL